MPWIRSIQLRPWCPQVFFVLSMLMGWWDMKGWHRNTNLLPAPGPSHLNLWQQRPVFRPPYYSHFMQILLFLYGTMQLLRSFQPRQSRLHRYHTSIVVLFSTSYTYRTRAILTRGLYTFYPLFEVHLCTVTFGLMYG